MLPIFSPLGKRLSVILKYQEIRNDNFLFRLHCIFTAVVLVAASLILTTSQQVGSPIECLNDAKDKDWNKAIQTYCWITSTFTMPDFKQKDGYAEMRERFYDAVRTNPSAILDVTQNGVRVNEDVFNQLFKSTYRQKNLGLGNIIPQNQQVYGKTIPYQGISNEYEYNGAKKYYPYYQWVCFALFFQAILCYLPKVLWDFQEGDRLTKLATGLHGCFGKVEEREQKTEAILCYLLKYQREHKMYAIVYWFCEGLCLLNVALQMWLMDYFLGGDFHSVGPAALWRADMPQNERFDPLIYIFPRITKCVFYYYGPSGTVVNIDSLCILPQNVFNEKIYVFLWFWYIALAAMFAVVLFLRLVIFFLPGVRPRLLVLRCRVLSLATACEATDRLDFGDWWMMYLLAKNINPRVYRDLVTDFVKRSKKLSLLHN